ncbi:MAG TPA: 2'-5' RNA ligase family protein [Acidobacteriaceae bacterium]|jgi:N12 class adenine-specific DNA methylase/GGDEF domain-containing protein
MSTQAVTLDPGDVEVQGAQSSGQQPVSLGADDVEIDNSAAEAHTAAQTRSDQAMRTLGQGMLANETAAYQPPTLPAAPNLGRPPARQPSVAQTALNDTTPPSSRFVTPQQPAPTTYQEATTQASTHNAPVLSPGEVEIIGGPRSAAQIAGQTDVQEEPLGAAIAGPAPGTRPMNPQESATYENSPPTGFGAGPQQAAHEIWEGTGDIARGAGYGDDLQIGPRDPSMMARGATETMRGAMYMGTPMFAEAAASAPVKAGLSYLAGVVGGKAAGAAAKAAGLTPDEQEFWNTAGFFIPNALTALAGVRGVSVQGPDGTAGKGFTAFGGRVGGGVATSPEAVGAGVRVGPFSASVVKPRDAGVQFSTQTPTALPDPAEVLRQQQNDASMRAALAADALDQASSNVINGKPPVPPQPKPPMPAGMDQAVLHADTVQRVAGAISMAPPQMRPQLTMEAHQNLAKWIAEKGTVMGPDGRIATAKTPEQASAIAAKWINDEVARQDTARNEAAKAQKEASAKAASNQEGKNEVTPPPTLQQRAQTVIDANEAQTPVQVAKTLLRQVGIPYSQGLEMVKQARAGKAPSIETAGEPVAPEAKAEIDGKVDDLKAGNVKAVLLPEGSSYIPTLPEGIKRVDVRQGPGAGTYLYDPQAIRAATIKAAAKAGTHEDLLAPNENPVKQNEPESLTEPPAVKQEVASSLAHDGDPLTREIEDKNNLLAFQPIHPDDVPPGAKPNEDGEFVLEVMEEPTAGKLGKIIVGQVKEGAQRGKFVLGNPVRKAKTTVGASVKPPAPERRQDTGQRQRVAEMSPEDMRRTLLTSDKTGLPNRRAFDEAEHGRSAPAVAMSDADGLKALNDKFGYAAGDALLKAKAEALQAAGLEAYHDKGDEFLYRGASANEIKGKLERAREILRNRTIEVETTDGETLRFKGADFSYGTGANLGESETALKSHKSQREASGERARGELRGITEVGPEKGEVGEGAAAGSLAARGPAATMEAGAEAHPALAQLPREQQRAAAERDVEAQKDQMAAQLRHLGQAGAAEYARANPDLKSLVDDILSRPEASKEVSHVGSADNRGVSGAGTEAGSRIAEAVGAHPEGGGDKREPAPGESPLQPRSAEPAKYKYGNTQAAIPKGSDADRALAVARARIDPKDLISTEYGGNSEGLETEPHITLRYGLKDEETAGIRAFLEKQAPFEATLGKTTSFPPSKSSDGGAPIIAPVEAADLRRIEAELDKHGNFIDRTFPEYKPHATLGYVKPETASKYVGMTETEGKTFPVKAIEISMRDGSKEVVPLKGGSSALNKTYEAEVAKFAGDPKARMERVEAENRRHAEQLLAEKFPGQRIGSAGRVEPTSSGATAPEKTMDRKGGRGESPEQTPGAAIAKGARVSFTDRTGKERTGVVAHTDGRIARIKDDTDRKSYSVAAAKVKSLAAAGEQAQNEETNASGIGKPAGLAEAGGGRPAPVAESSDRERLGEASTGVLPGVEGEGNAPDGNQPDRSDVRGDLAPVSEQGAEPGPGAGSDTGIDRAPAGPVIRKATAALAKPKALNREWFSHADAWKPPTGTVGRLEANLNAIRILRDVEKSPRKLTDAEKEALSNYVGWGALQHAFMPYGAPHDEIGRWRAANAELQKLLTPDELARAQESTKNAHYTSPELVRFMWDTMARFGFKAGNVLEPAAGTGNFLGMMPKGLRAKVNAIANEMDAVSFGITKLLYPGATLFNKDFADLILPDNDVDVAIGNPPFGGYKLYDPTYKKLNALVHDFFFVKSLDKVRPGGVLAFITSTGTLDKMDPDIRNILASKADFLGAIRLPSGAFKANAGTDVTTDLIFLQKRAPGQTAKHAAEWTNSVPQSLPTKEGNAENLNVNEYFQKHPEMMLGKPTASTKMYGGMGFLLEPHEGRSIPDLLKEAQGKLPRGIIAEAGQQATGNNLASTAAEFAPDALHEGQYTVDAKGTLKQRVNGKLVNPEAVLDKAGKPVFSKIQRFKALVDVRDSMNRLLSTMVTAPDDEIGNSLVAGLRESLQKDYDAFVRKYGYLNSSANGAFRDDPHYPRLLALETWDKAARQGTPADIFRRRTIFPREELRALPEDPAAALQLVLAERGFPDVQMMGRLRNEPVANVVKKLADRGLIYRNPASGNYETRETYLSGYVRDKLKDAKRAVTQGMKDYAPNVEALEKVIPADIEIGEDPKTSIAVRLGSTWIPTDAIEEFIRDTFKSPGTVKYNIGNWQVRNIRDTAEARGLYSTPRAGSSDLLEDTLNLRQTTIYDYHSDGSRTLNSDATTAAQAAQQKIREAFQRWAVASPWKPELQRLYNDAYNNLAQVEYDGSHLTFPGMNSSIRLTAHQVNAVWRILQDGRALLAHVVGAGKTFEMVAAAMEGRRVGTFKKPMITVPNHIVEQFRQEFLHLYPGANLLVPSETDFDAKNRQRIMSRIATGNFDAVILPHSQFNLMDISPERQRVTIQKQKAELRETIQAVAEQEGKKSRTVKQLEKAMAALDATLKKLADLKADKAINFDDTGIDQLFVDEAHMYKNLSFYTKMTRIAGLQQAKAKSALRLKMKTEYLQDRNGGRGVVFATGTPVQNTMAELYTMFKYVAPDVLEKAGIRFFDDWAANFGSVITAMELAADGRSYKARSKFAQFQNVPELMNMFRSFADIKTAEDLNLPTPELETGKPIVVPVPASPRLEAFVSHLMERAERVKSGSVDPRVDNMLKITTDGRKAATDMRLIDPTLPDDTDSKINKAVDTMFEVWKDGKEELSAGPTTQMGFLDLYRSIEGGKTEDGTKIPEKELINLYRDIKKKLMERGVPAEQIAIIGEHDTRVKRQALFSAMNAGKVRILLGSTFKMGAGTNAQRLLKALHHIDLTWRPGDLEQRNGRAVRQGNLNPSVRLYNYLTERSFDAYMAQTLQGKAEFISQVMSGRNKQRVMADAASEMVLSLEEMKIAASGNPDVKIQYDLQMQAAQLRALERNFFSQRRMNQQEASMASMRADRFEADVTALSTATEKIKAAEATGAEDGKGIKVEVDGKTFTDRKALFDHLEAMDIPPVNFHMTWNGIGVAVEVKPANKESQAQGISGLNYQPDYITGRNFAAPSRDMTSLARSLESRLRQIPTDLEEAKVELPRLRAKAQRLDEIAQSKDFPEKAQMEKVEKELAEVERRLGIRSDVENAMAQAVTAEVSDDPEEDLLSDNDGEEDPEAEEQQEDADKADEGIAERDETPRPGVVLRSSLLGLDVLAEFAAKQGKVLWDADIAPNLSTFGEGARSAGKAIVNVLYPRLGANDDAQDILARARGKLESHLFHLETLDGGLEKFFEAMPRDGQLAFIDRYKLGVGQPDARLQQIEDIMRRIDDASLREAQRYKPTLQAKEDHFRVIWKVVPFGGGAQGGKTAQFAKTKRPWQGDKGFMRRATLDTISEGINAGGVPVTTNPWKLFTLAQSSMMKFISAQQAWAAAKTVGLRKYVERGQQVPEGWVKINDRIADVYFPEKALSVDVDQLPTRTLGPQKKEWVAKEDLETHRVMANPGSWYGEPGFGRLLNNYLSPDLLRQSALGKGLLFAKNLSTAIELGMSPFHLIFETLEAMGSQFGLGVQRVWNNGVRLGDGRELTRGMTEIGSAVAAPFLISHAGGSLKRFATDPAQFFSTTRGQRFLRQYPNAAGAMQELFNGGLTWGIQRDYRFDPQKSMIEAAKEGNYIGAVLRVAPWINTVLMKPLFEAYIPRLKWGLALQQYSQQLVENQEALGNGDMTRTEIARKVADTVENRFGEMNFNNIYWNNTFKSVLQLLFRSVTWKLGNWRGLGSAAGPEAFSAFRDPLEAMRKNARSSKGTGPGARAGEYIPRIGMNQAWILGMVATTAVIGSILTRYWTRKWPWEIASEDREEGYSLPGALALEVVHPRTGRINQFTGKPERLSLPTGLRDFEHAFRDPGGYIKGSLSGTVSHLYDTLENQDAFKNYVYDPNGSLYRKTADIFAYNMPEPISFQNWHNQNGAVDTESRVLRAAGVGNASSSLDYSPAETRMRAVRFHQPQTPEQMKAREQEHMQPTRTQIRRAIRDGKLDYAQKLFRGLSYAEARDIYDNYATPAERAELAGMLREKRNRTLQREGRQ